jgi:transcriptional regulator with XRE-family HTH domain
MEGPLTMEHRLAARIRDLRLQRGFSIEELVKRSGVSRSTISLIERAEVSATANILDKLAASLGMTLASLFAEPGRADAAPLTRRKDQVTWRDPATGYIRRNLSPSGFPSPIELVEVVLPADTHVAYDSGFRSTVVDQQIWLLEGTIEVTTGQTVHQLASGDCLAMRIDRPTSFRNQGAGPARYLVALATDAAWVPAANIKGRNPE